MSKAAPVSEETVLKPRKAGDLDEDAWPEFCLDNVAITKRAAAGKKVFGSLLDACVQSPVEVTGLLAPVDKEQKHLVLKSFSEHVPLKLTNVVRSSFAEFEEDKSIGFWAAGQAGWYWIQPSNEYKATYAEMTRAVKLWYLLSDNYEMLRTRSSVKRKQDPITMQQVFELCDDLRGEESLSYPTKSELRKHANFLLSEMWKDGNSSKAKWSKVVAWPWLQECLQNEPEKVGKASVSKRVSGQNDSSHSSTESPFLSRTQKSILKPKSQVAEKLVARSARQPKAEKERPEFVHLTDEDIDSLLAPKRRRTARNTVKIPDLESDDDDVKPPPNTAGDDLIDDIEGDEDDKSDDDLPLTRYPVKHRPSSPSFQLISEPLPSTRPQGPDDIWTCTVDGCKHKVFDANSDQGQKSIRAHYQSHVPEAEERLDLVWKEGGTKLPV
ncbi:MAG: hypothetical protein M1837_002636 [Sclerophora amabilis]|nr:MAG: hypothetical protein M1837_002636 [Sclerophora amabilis]